MRPKDEFNLIAKVHVPYKHPFSCILDGIQCSTKCIIGKENLMFFK
ncbi:MAG: FmdE family protein [Candidatus Baldrarchaeia archaeon]